jgi:hypothetical protein
MSIARFFPRRATMRDITFMSTPSLWSVYPFLPVIRRGAVGGCQQLGVLYDAVGVFGRYGYTATVWLANLFLLPKTEAELFELPKIVYDTLDELVEDGWVVD